MFHMDYKLYKKISLTKCDKCTTTQHMSSDAYSIK